MSALIHHLTHPGCLTASTVVCGAATAALATWDAARVTCPTCRLESAGARWQGREARPRRHQPGGMSEKALQEEIRQMAVAGNWLYYHTHDARHSPAGFPDTVCVRLDPAGAGARLVVAELKMPGEAPTDAQKKWLTTLGRVTTVETFVWYPADLARALEVLR